MPNYYADPSDIAAEGYFRNMAAQDAREANAYNRRRIEQQDAYTRQRTDRQDAINNRAYQQEQAQKAAEMAIEALAGGADEGQVAAFLTDVGNDIGSPFNADTHMPILKSRANVFLKGENSLPSNVQEWRYYNSLSEADQQRFLEMKRGGKLFDLGGGGKGYLGAGGQQEVLVTPEIATTRDATRAGAVVSSQEAAKTAEIPARNRVEIDGAIERASALAQQDAVRALPAAIDKAEAAMKVIDSLASHPGLPYLVGMYSMAPIVPGTDQAAADAYMKQIEGQAFLEAYASLKGTGQITQIEGEKATNALIRMSRRQDKEAYVQGLIELREVIAAGLERAKKSAMPKDQLSSLQKNLGDKLSTSIDLPVGTVDGGYEFLGGDPSKPESWKKVQ